jgi:hypothetical protein
MTIETPKGASEHPEEPGMRGTYGQGDFVESAQRSRLRKDQHYGPRPSGSVETPDPYGEGGFAGGGGGREGPRQSGYGKDFGQLEGAQRHEKQASERDYKNPGTVTKSSR